MKKINKALIVCVITFIAVVAGLAYVVAENDNEINKTYNAIYEETDDGKLSIESVDPINYQDSKYGTLQIVYSGTIEYEVTDEDFLERTYEKNGASSADEYITNYLNEKIVNDILKIGTSYETIVNNSDMISEVFIGDYTGYKITAVNLEFKLSDESEQKVLDFEYNL